jgi:hypothetical protein
VSLSLKHPMTFRSKTFMVSILPNAKEDAIEYQVSNQRLKKASESWKPYSHPFEVSADAQIWARSVNANGRSIECSVASNSQDQPQLDARLADCV